jgi:cytochrome c-type biogenesis protein CcmE
MTRQQQRLGLLALGMAALGGATALVLTAFSGNLVFFFSPSELRVHPVAAEQRVRMGGLVEARSLARDAVGDGMRFRVTDGKTDLAVVYHGVLPDLFREGQGVVVEGRLRPDGVFVADSVLAKHDARYMPREVVEALKRSGRWQEGGPPGTAALTPAVAGGAAAQAPGSRSSLDAAVRKAGRSGQP